MQLTNGHLPMTETLVIEFPSWLKAGCYDDDGNTLVSVVINRHGFRSKKEFPS